MMRSGNTAIESRFLHRCLSAAPDLISACYLAYMWVNPGAFGRDGVVASLFIVAVELPLLAALGGAILIRNDNLDFYERAKGVGFLAVGTVLAFHIVHGFYAWAPSFYLLATFASVMIGKYLIFLAGRHNPPFFEGMRIVLHIAALGVLIKIFGDGDVPRLGFDQQTLANLDIPARFLLNGTAPEAYDKGITAWSATAGGIGYFLICACARYFMTTRRLGSSRKLLSRPD